MAATSSNSSPLMESQCVIQPRRLKDFLQDQNLPFPRKSPFSVFLHAAVSSVKSSSILRRSISRRFSTKNKSPSRLPEPTMTRTMSVTVKDILRWKSFRDLGGPVENDVPQMSDFTTEVTSSATTSAATPRSSWSDSDFTVGDSPVWCRGVPGEIEVAGKQNFHINVAAGERLRRTSGDPKDPIIQDEEEQFSPISVLDFTKQHEEIFSPFHQILANMERRNTELKQQIQDFENLIKVEDNNHIKPDVESFKIEEISIQILDNIKTTGSVELWDSNFDSLLLDFIRDELISTKGGKNSVEFESRVSSIAKSWVGGEDVGSLDYETDRCNPEMEKLMNWKDFEEEQEEIGIEMEKIMLNHLLDELSMEILNL